MSDNPVGRPRQTTHDEIRRTAVALFAEHGYAETSLVQIAAASGISRTTLFSYFPAKSDLLWEDHDRLVALMEQRLAAAADDPAVDTLVAGMLAIAHYGVGEHEGLALRWRIVRDDPALRAVAFARSDELLDALVAAVVARRDGIDVLLVDSVARALMAVASRCTEEWSLLDAPAVDLDVFTAERLRPIADALRPLLG
ncbi:TetR/AcrR family transcriptional regulator [Microbacterium fluvii]|uniref:TetR/AcrR family transcriptional regulator n=1 Tax=Microbacterium fluvii TaxID=415215 RepID=A0ABW2HHP2_9MICO|nr:TetR/AcrR family transcriptional regulator [Microbacterium fluvii]MCU4673185.1 TetR/AcrR family transcriptional regulator [Microbacterium fluvii]